MTAPSIKEALEYLEAAANWMQRYLDTYGELGDDATQANIDDWHDAVKHVRATLSPPAGEREAIARIMVCNDPNYETYHMPGDTPRKWKAQSGYVGTTSELSEDCAESVRKRADKILASGLVQDEAANGNRALPYDRDQLGRFVREAWVRWAETQPNPKPSWLLPYDDLDEPDKEADRQIGEAVARWTLIGDAAIRSARDGGAES